MPPTHCPHTCQADGDEERYPEAYRKSEYVKGSNLDVPKPFQIGTFPSLLFLPPPTFLLSHSFFCPPLLPCMILPLLPPPTPSGRILEVFMSRPSGKLTLDSELHIRVSMFYR